METIIINEEFVNEAKQYAILAQNHLSSRHSFHSGNASDRVKKMFEGKLGEKAIKQFFIKYNIPFKEDTTDFTEADCYDFLVREHFKVDVKTRTKIYHTRTLEMVEQTKKRPKDVYISVFLCSTSPYTVQILGYITKEEMLKIGRIENNGYLDNYVVYDRELRKISELI